MGGCKSLEMMDVSFFMGVLKPTEIGQIGLLEEVVHWG